VDVARRTAGDVMKNTRPGQEIDPISDYIALPRIPPGRKHAAEVGCRRSGLRPSLRQPTSQARLVPPVTFSGAGTGGVIFRRGSGVPVARCLTHRKVTCRAAAQLYLAPPPQEILEQVDAAPSIAVADVVAGRVNLAQFGAGDAIAHLLIGAGMPDLLAAGGYDQRRRAHLGEVLHEIVGAHVRDEAPDEGRIVRAGLLYEPRDVLGIGALIEALGNCVGQEALKAHLADPRDPGRRVAVLQARRRAEERQRFDAPGVMDRDLLGDVAAGRVADDVRSPCPDEIEELERVTNEMGEREWLLRRRYN